MAEAGRDQEGDDRQVDIGESASAGPHKPMVSPATAGLAVVLLVLCGAYGWKKSQHQTETDPRSRGVNSMLIAAVRRGDAMGVWQTLFLYRASPNAQDSDGQYAISLAAEAPVVSHHTVMLASGPCITLEKRRGYPEIVTALVNQGARTDVRNLKGLTPLDQARRMDETAVVKLLTSPNTMVRH